MNTVNDADGGRIEALVLAGGVGSRLRAVVADRPKVLAPVHGRPFLSYLLDALDAVGIRRIVLCTGYLAEQVEHAFGEQYGRLQIAYSRETTPLGTGGCLRAALPQVDSATTLVLNGDSFVAFDFAELLAAHRDAAAQGTLLLTEVPDVARFGAVACDERGRITSFEEKGAQAGPGLINAGVYLLERSLLVSIPADGAVSLEREMFPAWMARGLFGQRTTGKFLDIGTPESFAEAERFFAAAQRATS